MRILSNVLSQKIRNRQGNTTALVAAILGIALVLIAFVLLNFNQLIGTHKQAQTAIDAAALQVAKDIGEIVIGPSDGAQMGYVSLSDHLPANNNFNNPPIVGINTLMATARLDALIADKLQNTTISVLAVHDLERVKQDSRLLRSKLLQAINGGQVKDRSGNAIDIIGNAEKVYDANAIRLGKGKRDGHISITIGRLKDGEGATNIPVPQPLSMAQMPVNAMLTGGNGSVYKPYVPIDTNVGSVKLTYIFTAVGSEPSLVANDSFRTFSTSGVDDFLAPSVVQVAAHEIVNAMASTGSARDQSNNAAQDGKKSKMRSVATAVAGSERQTYPSGSLQLAFPGGKPPANSIDCSSVKSIMNSSQITVASLPQGNNAVTNANTIGSPSPYQGCVIR